LVDPESRVVTRDRARIPVTAREFDLLHPAPVHVDLTTLTTRR